MALVARGSCARLSTRVRHHLIPSAGTGRQHFEVANLVRPRRWKQEAKLPSLAAGEKLTDFHLYRVFADYDAATWLGIVERSLKPSCAPNT